MPEITNDSARLITAGCRGMCRPKSSTSMRAGMQTTVVIHHKVKKATLIPNDG
jgi:hypothetical protein